MSWRRLPSSHDSRPLTSTTLASVPFPQEKENAAISVTASGNVISKAVSVAEIIKSKFEEGGVEQDTHIAYRRYIDVWKPLLEGLDT